MYGCELRSDGSKGGYMQFGYDGRDYISLDKETLRWTAADFKAQLTKQKWEKDPAIAQGFKAYLEKTCIELLQRSLDYSKETLQRTEPPEVKVTRHESPMEDTETLVCQAHGFYPKEIDATWTKDGQRWEHATFRRRVVPNPDGTYYISLYTDIDPKERGHYRCRVAHAGLSQPLVLAWEGPAGNMWIILGAVTGALVLLLLVFAGIVMKKRRTSNSHTQQSQEQGDSELLEWQPREYRLPLWTFNSIEEKLIDSAERENAGAGLVFPGIPAASIQYPFQPSLTFPVHLPLVLFSPAGRLSPGGSSVSPPHQRLAVGFPFPARL
ncbi:RLA class I histocompatibility antigen, alpha chain 11/11-like isoform X5 [Varanus komodoensis]|uniref:RLA class I histocompatibility antigen, alpha chain 11/11-like isoform X5 n=1 Tax=Varanus komodoensis TaxID=61221 RepID=UPI001CF7DC88|nr:RLA class I histocompatibility antigen, alpha chain 11/11-like isoform X5 [Varanus komodoensis]